MRETPDRVGIDREGGRVAEFLRGVVPASVARRSVTVSLSVGRRRLPAGAPVPFAVEIRNRLPVSIAVPTPTHRLWTWAVDDYREGTDEAVHTSGSGHLTLRGRERRRIEQEWNGLIGKTRDGRTRWVDPAPGTHELRVWVATDPPCASDSVRLELH